MMMTPLAFPEFCYKGHQAVSVHSRRVWPGPGEDVNCWGGGALSEVSLAQRVWVGLQARGQLCSQFPSCFSADLLLS